MTLADAEPIRRRARTLRHYGAFLESCTAIDLFRRAGPSTWIGPTPQRCDDDLQSFRSRLQRAHDDLVSAAVHLERHADVVEAQPPVPVVPGLR